MNEVTLAGYDWTTYFIWLIALGVLYVGVAGFLFFMDARWERHHGDSHFQLDYSGWFSGAMYFSIIGFFIYALVFGVAASGISEEWDKEQRVAALYELGYEDVQLEQVRVEDGFVASKDGQYIFGIFLKVQGEQWKVKEL